MARRFPFIFRSPPEPVRPRGGVSISESVIEASFWGAYKRLHPKGLAGLVQQHRVGPYRIDFAIPRYRIGIELDGFRNHSNTVDIALDHARQRDLQKLGWVIIRFGGLEVHKDVDRCVREAAFISSQWKGGR